MNSTDATYSAITKLSLTLELTIGTAAVCLTGLCLAGYLKLHRWKNPSALIVMNLLGADLLNGVLSPFHAALCKEELELAGKQHKELFRLVFFFQSMYLSVSLCTMILINISRLIAIVVPFRFPALINRRVVTTCLAGFWAAALTMSLVRRYVDYSSHYNIFLGVVLAQFSLHLIILGLVVLSLVFLRSYTTSTDVQRRTTLTLAAVSLAYFLSYGYYMYVKIVWMIPALPADTSNKWVQLTAVSRLSLTIAHIFLLLNNLFNGVMFGMQPDIRRAIQHVWVRDYYRSELFSEQQDRKPL